MGRQVARQLGPPRHRRLVGGLAELYLEPLALADGDHLPEPEAMARARDRLALRVMDLGLEHHLDDDSGHGPQPNGEARRKPLPSSMSAPLDVARFHSPN